MIFYRNLWEITFQLTNVIPEWIIFVSRGITVLSAIYQESTGVLCIMDARWITALPLCLLPLLFICLYIHIPFSYTSSFDFTLVLACKPNADRTSCNQLFMDFLHKWVANQKMKNVGWQLIFNFHWEVGFLSSGNVTKVQYVRPWMEQSLPRACGLNIHGILLSRTEHPSICSICHITSKISKLYFMKFCKYTRKYQQFGCVQVFW
jgi:hypothetical protein